ncbi:MAG: hypothetical protein K0R27_2696 [Xanthobacteraceae bacterium]|jgi:hypothetical protein|nr:hypothetical protein [Xanthobacteraceae bacterium]
MMHILPRHLAPYRLVVIVVLLVAGLPAAASAEDTGAAQAAGSPPAPHAVPTPKAVVELFTSQGCSSCPPADKLLGELAQRPDVLALTMAVDYWDYLGWKDTLAKHGHSLRQKGYAKVRGDGKMFTPQAILNGSTMAVGNDEDALDGALAAVAAPHVPVAISTKDGKLAVKVGAGTGRAEVWICPVASDVTVKIGRGENEGSTMTYHNVVRGWTRLGEWTGGEAHFEARLDELRADTIDSVAVLVQSGTQANPGPILGAALAPLP